MKKKNNTRDNKNENVAKSTAPTPLERAGVRLKQKFENYTVKEEAELLDFLMKIKNGISRTSVKSLLAHRQILVNNVITTQYNFLLTRGMKVQINKQKGKKEFQSAYIKLLYEDAYVLVIDKKVGIAPIANDKKKERSAHSILTEYVQRTSKTNKVYIIHGLDKEASGLMVFAKDEKTKFNFQDYWKDIIKEQKFVGILSGEIDKDSGTVSSWIADGKVMVTQTAITGNNNSDKASTYYNVIKRANGYSMVEFESSRKNQIRMHAFELKHPIVDDPKYGEEKNPILGRLALHGFKLHFYHPISKELMKFETPYPPTFRALMKKGDIQTPNQESGEK